MKVIRFSDLCAQGQATGKRVFIRADLNVPQDDAGRITEDTRIRASIPCIQMALDAGAAVMVTSHLGRPTEGEFKPEDSLAPIAKRLSELLGKPVALKANWVDGVDVAPGEVGEICIAGATMRKKMKMTTAATRAPISGRVLRIFQESVAVVAPGTPLLEVGDPAGLEVEADVDDRDLAGERLGGGRLHQPFPGRLRRTRHASTVPLRHIMTPSILAL